MTTILPSKSEYQRVLQSPHIYLQDPNLKVLKVEKDQFGLPWVRSGGFALTYKLQNSHQTYALRCFHKPAKDREVRYSAISKFLRENSSDIFVGVEYQPMGILVDGKFNPITIMEWVNGYTLGTYIDKNIKITNNIKRLSVSFTILVNELERLQIAHGDLSSKNIIIRDGKMVLVDYDGMYVPALHGCLNNELGNPSFQHPGRNETHFGPNIDHFSEIVIYLALEALSESPSLYQRYGMGTEGLLFTRNDFLNCSTSALLQEIRRIKKLELLVDIFERICLGDILEVPTLSSFINDPILGVSLPKPVIYSNIHVAGYKTIAATNIEELSDNIYDIVTVIGKIDGIKRGSTVNYKPYVFLNVGFYPNHTFTIVIWSEILTLLEKSDRDPTIYENNWISVYGVLDKYSGKFQIVLDSPTDIAIISEDEALQRLGLNRNQNDLNPVMPSAEQLYLGDSTIKYGYALTPLQIADPAEPGFLFEPVEGERLIAVEIVVANISGKVLESILLDVTLTDMRGNVYELENSSIYGQISLVSLFPGERVQGWVTYLIPEGTLPASLVMKPSFLEEKKLEVKLTTPPTDQVIVPIDFVPRAEASKLGDNIQKFGYELVVTNVEDDCTPDPLYDTVAGYKLVSVELILRNVENSKPLVVSEQYAFLVDDKGYVHQNQFLDRDDSIGWFTTKLALGEQISGRVSFSINEDATPAYIKFEIDGYRENYLISGLFT